ncbi:hypothetical protein SDC9_161781 [bioreactor metagenome]|uniref:Uncharacterized protein n=1 Tax=bioreactor metagenome TaxID=1076179 RepID=A0A645FQE5_9ZZZZ
MAHALAANLGSCYLDAAAVAYLTLVSYLLVFSAVALPVLRGAEYLLAEKSVALGFERTVIYRLRLFNLAV